MKTKSAKTLPQTVDEILNGGVYAQRRRCGKKNCKCTRGEKHLGYFFFTRRGGKLTKTYIRKSQVKSFSRLVNIAAEERKIFRQRSRHLLELLKEFRQSLRDARNYINSLGGC